MPAVFLNVLNIGCSPFLSLSWSARSARLEALPSGTGDGTDNGAGPGTASVATHKGTDTGPERGTAYDLLGAVALRIRRQRDGQTEPESESKRGYERFMQYPHGRFPFCCSMVGPLSLTGAAIAGPVCV